MRLLASAHPTVLLDEIIARVNELFQGELTDDDKLVYVNNVLKTKLLESEILYKQAMSKQALDSPKVRDGLRDILLGPGQLYEALRGRVDLRP